MVSSKRYKDKNWRGRKPSDVTRPLLFRLYRLFRNVVHTHKKRKDLSVSYDYALLYYSSSQEFKNDADRKI